MTHHQHEADLEQELIDRLATLPTPIRIGHHTAHGTWYQWHTMLTGTGDCGTFADAVIQGITYQQEQHQTQRLIATPGRYKQQAVTTLGECLRRTQRVRPTSILYMYLGVQGWLKSMDAYDLVVKSRSMNLSWDAYIEDGHGPEPVGIYLFGLDGSAYRGFEVEMENE